MLWFTKGRRAQNVNDYETWIEGGVAPTLNTFDNGDVRATTIVASTVRFRGGKPGGGKGPLVADGISQVLTTPNDQILFTIKEDDMKAYDEYNDSISDVHHTLRAGTKQSTGVMVESNVRRLTPVECERLQGFPDNWTEGQADSHRYKQMGNAVAVPVVEWIIQNICDTL